MIPSTETSSARIGRRLTPTSKIGFASFDVGLIVIGDDAYMTNFLTGDWEGAPSDFEFNPALLFDEDRGIGAVMNKMDDVELADESTVGGTKTVQLTGTVRQRDIREIVAGSLRGARIGVSIWIDATNGNLLEISLAEPDDVDGDAVTWTIRFSDHNEPVTIEAP